MVSSLIYTYYKFASALSDDVQASVVFTLTDYSGWPQAGVCLRVAAVFHTESGATRSKTAPPFHYATLPNTLRGMDAISHIASIPWSAQAHMRMCVCGIVLLCGL